jgi:hypothetical protein
MLSGGFSIAYLNGLEPQMQECIRTFEEFLDSECTKGNGSAVVNVSLVLSNLAFVRFILAPLICAAPTL